MMLSSFRWSLLIGDVLGGARAWVFKRIGGLLAGFTQSKQRRMALISLYKRANTGKITVSNNRKLYIYFERDYQASLNRCCISCYESKCLNFAFENDQLNAPFCQKCSGHYVYASVTQQLQSCVQLLNCQTANEPLIFSSKLRIKNTLRPMQLQKLFLWRIQGGEDCVASPPPLH